MNTCKIYVVRHGQSEHNRDNLVSGHVNPALTEIGEKQARTTKQKLAQIKFDDVYSSDLQRAAHTAEIIYGSPVPADHQLEGLRERNYGHFEGMPNEHFQKTLEDNREHYATLPVHEQWTHKHAPDVESDAELAERFMSTLAEIAEANAGKTILVAAHGGTLRTSLIKLGYATNQQLPGGSIDNAAYIELDYVDGSFEVGATDGVNKQS